MISRLGKDSKDADITAALARCNPYAVPEILHSHSPGTGAGYKDIAAVKLLKALSVKPYIGFARLLHCIVGLGKGWGVAHYYVVGAGPYHLKVLEHIPVNSLDIAGFLGNLVQTNHLLKE